MSHPVPPAHSEPQQEPAAPPYSPAGQPFDGTGAPKPPSKLKKIAGIAVPVVAAGVAGASWLGIGGGGDPEVGDCGAASGESSFEVVDCASDEAQFRVVGIEEEKMTQPEYEADTTACAEYATANTVLWVGDGFGSDGTVLCAEPA